MPVGAVQLRRRGNKRSDSPVTGSDDDDDKPLLVNGETSTRRRTRHADNDSVELENLVAREVREWRSEVNRSQTQSTSRGLKHRKNVSNQSALDDVCCVPMIILFAC